MAGSEPRYRVVAYSGGTVVERWDGDDQLLAVDAGRELLARGYDVEVFKHGRFLGCVKHATGALSPISGHPVSSWRHQRRQPPNDHSSETTR